jgi:hypothetical protein
MRTPRTSTKLAVWGKGALFIILFDWHRYEAGVGTGASDTQCKENVVSYELRDFMDDD